MPILKMSGKAWQTDSYLSTKAREAGIEKENAELRKRLERLEAKVR